MIRILALVLLFLVSAEPSFAGPKTLVGTWLGSYVCGQGETGLTLSIVSQSGGDFEGFFHFYPTASNPTPKEGCFSVKGHLDDSDKVSILAKDWISRPAGYDTVDLNGTLDIIGGHIAGTVSVPAQILHSCRGFEIGWQHPKATPAPLCKGAQLQSALSAPPTH